MKKIERPIPPLSDERVDQLWRASAPRILRKERRATAQRRLAVAAVLVVAGFGVGWQLVGQTSVPQLAEGQTAEGPRTVVLADDSTVELGSDALMEVDSARPSEVEVRLERGRARFKVTKNRGRTFRVLAGTAEVRVVGTTFVVESSKDGVVVSVEEGIVEVRRGGELKRLSRGGTWRAAESRSAPEVEAAEPSPAAPPEELASPKSPAAPHRVKRAPSATSRASAPAPSPSLPPAPEGPTADELFGAAVDARRASGPRAAAQAWSTFLASFPGDARAGLAAFELGRIEMDVRADPAGALRALERALELSPAAAFAEDAMARLVRLRDQRHEDDACKAARARYLSRYPQGTYAASLSSLCGP